MASLLLPGRMNWIAPGELSVPRFRLRTSGAVGPPATCPKLAAPEMVEWAAPATAGAEPLRVQGRW